MRTRFDLELCLPALALGHLFSDQKLMDSAENYVAHQRREILLSDAWVQFAKDYPMLISPVIAMLRSKSQNMSLNLYDFEN
ncbi:hypothetical protein JTE90_004843 [Oedothorax gibbosus]|uniref:Uncharacterized protein n=1 Tax=Oedothorax gibbosus TaxID=931172 RepID=A0AAV6UQT0_9ARAC|nr:hypothetical protein JTE90_004843 [Oedothorax gibbosus]